MRTPNAASTLLLLAASLVMFCLGGCFRLGFHQPPDQGPEPDVSQLDATADAAADAAPDAPADQALPSPLITLGAFKAAWATPGTIRWTWSATSKVADFAGYTLVTGKTKADVLAQSGSAVVWTAKQNPELGHYNLPKTGGVDQVTATMTDGHEASTTYYGQLLAADSADQTAWTTVVSAKTQSKPTKQIIIFSESQTKGFSLPSSFKLSSSGAYQGSNCYTYTNNCSGGISRCWENLRRQDLKLPLTGLPKQAFSAAAYYEFAAACTGDHGYWADFWLAFATSTSPKLWHFSGWTLRCDGSYRLYQIPLRSFSRKVEGPLTYTELAHGLFEFNTPGAAWDHGAVVRVDEIRIRW